MATCAIVKLQHSANELIKVQFNNYLTPNFKDPRPIQAPEVGSIPTPYQIWGHSHPRVPFSH